MAFTFTYPYTYTFTCTCVKTPLGRARQGLQADGLAKNSTLDTRSGLDTFFFMLRPGWMQDQPDLVEARVSKINQKSFKFERRQKMRHGGKRAGAGRPIGSTSLASPEQRQEIARLARDYSKEALTILLDVAAHSTSDAARVSASVAILDRGYGKPGTAALHDGTATVEHPSVVRIIAAPETSP